MELDEDDAQAILNKMYPEEAAHVIQLMAYESDKAGGLMRTEYFAFEENSTVGEITEHLRLNSEKYLDYPLKIYFCYQSRRKIVGSVTNARLVTGKRNDSASPNYSQRSVLPQSSGFA